MVQDCAVVVATFHGVLWQKATVVTTKERIQDKVSRGTSPQGSLGEVGKQGRGFWGNESVAAAAAKQPNDSREEKKQCERSLCVFCMWCRFRAKNMWRHSISNLVGVYSGSSRTAHLSSLCRPHQHTKFDPTRGSFSVGPLFLSYTHSSTCYLVLYEIFPIT